MSARPPGVVSGLPNMTPIFSRNWLVKITEVFELLDGAGQLAQRLAHQARLQAHVRVAHLALDLGARHQRGHRVDHDHIHRAAAHQHLDDLQRLLAGVGLRDQQIVDVDAQPLGVGGIERVLGVDDRRRCRRAAGRWR